MYERSHPVQLYRIEVPGFLEAGGAGDAGLVAGVKRVIVMSGSK
jgi:hypothetical protein